MADTPPQHHLYEMVRLKNALVAMLDGLGADKLTGELGEPKNDREAIASTFSWSINGLEFGGRFWLKRGTH